MGAGYSGWLLSVDFGTSNIAAGHVDEATGTVRTLPLSYNGDLMPSVAYVHPSGQIDVGAVALNQAAGNPLGFLPAPKRLLTLGQTTFEVGDWAVPADRVVAAMLQAVLARAMAQHHGRMPDGLVLTHPEGWSGHQIRVLIDAAVGVGCPPHLVRTVAEPQAAAHFYAGHTQLSVGERVAVFDFGGGTLDVTVLAAAADGSFEIAAARGDNTLGGRNFDAAIRRWVDGELSQRNSILIGVLQADSTTREQQALEDSIRQAKELLSEASQAVIDVYGGTKHEALLLNRTTFEGLIAAEVARATQLAQATFQAAGIESGGLRAIYLAGGSSRVPLVQQQIQELGPVATIDDPKTVVARGALVAAGRYVTAPPPQAAAQPPLPQHLRAPEQPFGAQPHPMPEPPPFPVAPQFQGPPPFPGPPPFSETPPFPEPPPFPEAQPLPEPQALPEPRPLPQPQPLPDNRAAEPHSDLFAAPVSPPWEFATESDYPSRYPDDHREDYSTPAPLFPDLPGKDRDARSAPRGATPLGSRSRRGGRRTPWRTILLVVGVLVVVGGLIAVALVGSGKHQSDTVAAPTTAVSTTALPTTAAAVGPAAPPSTSCTGQAGAGTTNLPGGQSAPIDVVNALEYGYYVQRDPAAVIALYAPNTLTDAGKQQIASFITSIPNGTTYCVTATQATDSLTVNYDVTETRPNAASNRYRMFLKVSPAAPYSIITLGQQK